MGFQRIRSYLGNLAEHRRRDRRQRRRFISRQYLLQQLEDRRLLAGPELIAIRPDADVLLTDGDTLKEAPREFNLLFKGGANLDEATIKSDSIKLVRSGGDDVFGDAGTASDVDVALGYIGLVEPGSTDPADLQRIVFRAASSAAHNSTDSANAFPDDLYQIQIIGMDPNPLKDLSGDAFNDGNDLITEFRLDRGAQVVAIVPQPITPGATLTQAANEIVVYFDDQDLDPAQVIDPAFYRLVNTAASLMPGDDTTSLPTTVTYDSSSNSAVLDFVTPIPAGSYRLDIGQSGGDNSTPTTAVKVGTLSDANPFSENGFLGDSGGTSIDASDIDHYALELTGGMLTVTVTPHSPALNLRARLLNASETEVAIDGDAGVGSPNTFMFTVTTPGTYTVEVTSDAGTGSYRIDASVTSSLSIVDKDNSYVGMATDLGALGAAGVMISSQIERQSIPLPPRPGSEDEPAHRQIQREAHIGATGTTPTVPQATRIVRYYFPDTLGTDTSGNDYLNLISETEKQIVREIFEIYAQKSGYEFIETTATGHGGDQLMIGKGDMRSVSMGTLAPGQVAGLASGSFAVLDGSIYNQANRFFGDGFTGTMFHEIGHSLGLSHSYDIPSVQGTGVPNDIRPGDHDIVHLQRIVPPNSTDIDLYEFQLAESGRFRAETIAERLLPRPSQLNSVLTLYREVDSASGEVQLVARNDQYFGADSFLDLELSAGTYFIGVTSTGNTNYDPHVPDSGFGGTTDGDYDLKLNFEANGAGSLLDARGTPFDGDGDGRPGGLHSFWFQVVDSSSTIYVDKANDTAGGGDGSLSNPFNTISAALAAADSLPAPVNVQIVGNGGIDGNIDTLLDNRPYLVGLDTSGDPLSDGAEFLVPDGVNVMIHAGVLLKLRQANLDAGTSSAGVSRSGSSIQVLGTPEHSVYLRSLHNDSAGGDSDGVGPAPGSGDFGGIVFRDDSDYEADGIFLNYVNHADINNGGGKVFVDANESVFTPIHVIDARPSVSFNRITSSSDAAISASPDSFDDSLGRIGPDVYGNFLADNTIDGLFIRVLTPLGSTIDKLTVSGRLDDIDITHVLSENLIINGAAGGPLYTPGGVTLADTRAAGRLIVDPGTILKLHGSRIEAERGAGAIIAEGTSNRPVIFTSIGDDRFGGSGSFDSDSTITTPLAGDWGGLFFGDATSGSIDNAIIAFGGGSTPIEGGAADFNAIEVHQAEVRVANSVLQSNADGGPAGVRNGRGANRAATIYVRGAQPIILDNIITDNGGAAININANALRAENQRDWGRSTGTAQPFNQFADNHGPLVRLNRLENNGTNGIEVRGEELTTQSVWDDTDIVHVLRGEITVDNLHTFGGMRLQSSNSESLVVKLAGTNAGFTATGTPVEIIDRVGGTIHVLGTVGHPVVLTSLADDSVGAGFTPRGEVMTDTDNRPMPSTLADADRWRGFLFDEFSNDRNVGVVRELEDPLTNGRDVNSTPAVAQLVGTLAPDQKSGDENRRLGFEVTGFISLTDPDDVDVYSFSATAGTAIWIDIDRTNTALDAIVEVVNSTGTVLARSVRTGDPGNLSAPTLTQNPLLGGDHYTQNFRDPGLYYVLPPSPPSDPPEVGTYFVRVRSNPVSAGVTTLAGESRGEYQLQIRLDQVQEFPGSTIQFADIRFARTGIDVRGLPAHSPLHGDAGEFGDAGNTFNSAQTLVNLLETDVAALGISGELSNGNDVDWYEFDLEQTGVQVIAGVNDGAGTIAVVFDLDYSDNAVRGDTTIAVYDEAQNLIFVGRESNVADDQPDDVDGSIDDLSRGSLGKKDPFVGPIHLVPGGTYYVAVISDHQLPSALTGAFLSAPTNASNRLVRLEPINSLVRVVEDHIGSQGYDSNGAFIAPSTTAGLFDDISSAVDLATHITPFNLGDVALYVSSGDNLFTANPFSGGGITTRVSTELGPGTNDSQDIVMRSDGRFYSYRRLNNDADDVGALFEINPGTGATSLSSEDNIPGRTPTPVVGGNTGFEDFTTSDDVDALTFDRTGFTGGVPTYDLYYSVRETATSSKLYRATANGSAAPTGNPDFDGVMGDIQPLGVSNAVRTFTFTDGTGSATVTVEAKAPGLAGNAVTVLITRNDAATTVTNVAGSTITVNIDDDTGTAAQFTDALNGNAQSRALVTAVITSGAGAREADSSLPAGPYFFGGGAGVPLAGRVTGLAFADFDGGQLYGVTSAGEFLSIDKFSGTATVLSTFTESFQGLALGPQNVSEFTGGGETTERYKNTLFAIAGDGDLYALNTAGGQEIVFDSDADGFADAVTTTITGAGGITGLAFSPLDFNLWHPTTQRGGDGGHGINESPDETREAVDGETSFYFGLEGQDTGQHGVLSDNFQLDLASNANIANTYNVAGGALGSLTTDSFSLAGSVTSDRPVLYFNYFLDTQNHPGSNVADDAANPFRDSARVYISDDGGISWNLIATNNSQLSDDDPSISNVVNGDAAAAELPGFLSHLSDAGLNSMTPRDRAHQVVQELFDTGDWRQSRVDLSDYANEPDLRLRFDFSTAGAFDDSSDQADGLPAEINGQFGETSSATRSIRSEDNQHEGFYIDDIIVGYAERGEMVTGTVADSGITDLFAAGAAGNRTRDDDPGALPDILSGRYQLEVRRTGEYVLLADPDPPFVGSIFDTNDRHINVATETAFVPFEPSTFDVSGLLPPVATTLLGGFTAAEIEPWSVTMTNPFTEMRSLESGAVISTTKPVSIFQATRDDLDDSRVAADVDTAGVIRFAYDVSSALDTHGLRFFIDGVAQPLVVEAGEPSGIDTTLASGETGYQTVQFSFGGGNPIFTWVYDFIDAAVADGLNKAFIDDIQILQGGTGLLADSNRKRDQGIFIIDSNFITDSSVRGINVQPGTTEALGSVPHPGSTINFPQLNNERLVPSVVIQNNVIAGSSGIRFAGEANANPQRPVPFGRLVNNTLVGESQTGTGIEVVGLASPTLLNNLLTDLGTGINDNGVGTVNRSNFFQNNAPGGNGDVGSDPILAPAGDPLFVDAANGNYYLQTGSQAIDSSQNTEQDRFNFLNFKTELGIPASPINAPDRDVYGQLRVNESGSAGGGGSEVFKDRGAVDRSDKDAPYAVLLNPIDNEPGLDRDPNDTVVHLTTLLLENFTILLGDGRGENSPFEGTGVNGLTVDDPTDVNIANNAVTIVQNGVMLEQGVDYTLAYNELSGILLLTPLSTLWEQSSVYTITLNNTQLSGIKDRAGNRLRANQTDGTTSFIVIIPEVDIDYGDAPDSYQTLLASNGPRHIITSPNSPRLGLVADGEDDGQPAVTADGDDLLTGDDEDGLPVGSFVGATTTAGLFLDPFDPLTGMTSDPSEVIAFLNPSDPAGAVIPVTITGDGRLDAWIDFNGDGDFDELNEHVLRDESVVDGVTSFRVITPSTATPGLTYGRFRISTDGTQDFFGIAVDGEVEDFRVNIVDVAPPPLMPDSYTVAEDDVLTVDESATTPATLFVNDGLSTLPEFVHPQYRVDGTLVAGLTDTYLTTNGTVRIDNAATGTFTYTPDPDYYGPDTFRYTVSTQRNEGPEADLVAVYATVDITVTPENDTPGVSNTLLRTIEDIQEENTVDGGFLISASLLLQATSGDGDPMTTLVPQDESDQEVFLLSIATDIGGTITTLDASTPTIELDTIRGGKLSAVFEANAQLGTDVITSVLYRPAKDFNSENLPPTVGDFLDDEFIFTVIDDGISLPVPDTDPPNPVDPLIASATAFIRVTPQNDPPAPETDVVSISNPDYVSFFAPGAVPMVSVPTEDETLLIPGAFLLQNDEEGRIGTDDERTQFNGNDGPLTIIDVSVDPMFGTISVDASSDITFVPADDIFGDVLFTYTVQDAGIDQDAALDALNNPAPKLPAPLMTTITSTIFLEPVNDAPVAYDRFLNLDEVVEADGTPAATVTFTADDLLSGSGPASYPTWPISVSGTDITVPDAATMIDGETLTITDAAGLDTIVEFSTSTVPSVGTDVLVTYALTDTADEIAISLQDALLAIGGGGTAVGDTVSFLNITSITSNPLVPTILADASGVTLLDGATIIGGESVIVDTGATVTVFEFTKTGFSLSNADVLIPISNADDAMTVATALQTALAVNGIPSITVAGVGPEWIVSFTPPVMSAMAAVPVSSLVATAQSITVPAGTELIDGETHVINISGGGLAVIEFNTSGLASPGTDIVVQFTSADPAASIASRLESILRAAGFAATATGNEVSFLSVVDLNVGETPSAAGEFEENLPAPYDESSETLRVVAFRTPLDTIDVDVLGDGTHTLATSPVGGTLSLTFGSGAFVSGFYQPPVDYNERSPFVPKDLFEFFIADDGITTLPPPSGGSVDLDDQRSLRSATVTLTVTQTNDPPTFTTPTVINILEDTSGATFPDVITNVLPGADTADDEEVLQSVTFEIFEDDVPAGLMTALPLITPTGGLTFFPAPDAVGTAVYLIRGTDTDPLDSRFTDALVTVNVRPVNDAPRINPLFAGTMDMANADDMYAVAGDGSVTYTLPEDNTQAGGAISSYFIPLARDPAGVDYNRIGLLDVFVAGPDNELDGTDGGDQVLELFNFPARTQFGGQLSSMISAGQLIGLNYVPPLDFNSQIGGFDEFTYQVRDDRPGSGETYSIMNGILVPDRLTTNNRVVFALNPVNDRPEYTLVDTYIEAPEDAQTVVFSDFAFNINGGPPNTAFDETDVFAGQTVTFELTPIDAASSAMFAEEPAIDPDGTLTFKPAADVYGEFQFEVVATDSGILDVPRGDLNSSLPVTITIDIQPINDPPVVDPGSDPLIFTLFEDGTVDILVNGDTVTPGLLDSFTPGPANESADVVPGGNQSVSLTSPIPATTAAGGVLTPISDATGLTHFQYRPKANFVGTDSFIYTVVDNGVTVDINTGGATRLDPRIAANVVTLEVLAVNDAPQFSGAGNVVSDEDEGVVTELNWATNVQPGPASATDEAASQVPTFLFTQLSANTELFAVPPSAEIVDDAATLSYVTAPDANGVATFEVRLRDDGPTDLMIGDRNLSNPVTFTIRVNAVNDPPSFTASTLIPVDEDSGPYNEVWARNISPGPPDEASQSVLFEVETISGANLFQTGSAPTISDAGVLRFTPAPNANGTAVLSVKAKDSAGGETTPAVTLTIVIKEVPDRPIAVSDAINTNEDTVLVIPSSQLLANDIDPDLATNPLEELTVVMQPTSFSVSGASVTLQNGDITYDPTDSSLQSLRALSATINHAGSRITSVGGVFTFPNANLLINRETLTVNVLGVNRVVEFNTTGVASPGTHKVVQYSTTDSAAMVVTKLVNSLRGENYGASANGATVVFGTAALDSFSYAVRDIDNLLSSPVTVSINVVGINDAPEVRDDNPTLNPNGPTIIRVLDNDSDFDGTIDSTSLLVTLQPAFGSLSITPSGVVTYTPFGSFAEVDQFRYTVADNLGARSEREALVTIDANAAPIARDDAGGTFLDEAIDINVAANDFDPDTATPGDPDGALNLASIVIVSGPLHGEAIPQNNGTVRFVPTPGFVGTDAFRYTIADDEGRASEAASVSVRVGASRLQNPDDALDVNDDGKVTAIDALLGINKLVEADGGRIPVVLGDQGPPFFDVNGDLFITALDSLIVVNELSLRNALGEGEQPGLASPTAARSDDSVAVAPLESQPIQVANGEKVVDASVPDAIATDVIDLIAEDRDADEEARNVEALDAAFSDLL